MKTRQIKSNLEITEKQVKTNKSRIKTNRKHGENRNAVKIRSEKQVGKIIHLSTTTRSIVPQGVHHQSLTHHQLLSYPSPTSHQPVHHQSSNPISTSQITNQSLPISYQSYTSHNRNKHITNHSQVTSRSPKSPHQSTNVIIHHQSPVSHQGVTKKSPTNQPIP